MIKYNTVYRGQFYNQEVDPVTNLTKNVVTTVDIYDTTTGVVADPTLIIPLPMADQPVTLESVDNDEDKFKTVIRSIRATVNIHSSNTIGIETFVDGGDTRFFGHIYSDFGDFIMGPVSIGDVREQFQPDPNVISLVVTDGLGFMDDEELTDENGDVIMGTHNLWYYIRLALLKTSQSMEAFVVFNIREKFASTLNSADSALGHFLNYCSADARTFEGSNVGTMLTAKEVIERILPGCFITQFNGAWWVISLDEMQGDSDYNMFEVNEDGTFFDAGQVNYSKDIGDGEKMSWMNDDAEMSAERPLKKLDLKFLFEYPKEIPCNIDFERGDGADPTGAASEDIDYDPECWTFLREGVSNADLDSAPFAGSTGKLRKHFEFNYEKDRYFITAQAGGFRHYFKSEAIRTEVGGRASIGITYWFNNDVSAATINVMHLRIIGNDGSIWDMSLDTSGNKIWTSKVVTDPVFSDTIQEAIPGPTDMTERHSFSFETADFPVEGNLYIRLLNDLASPVIRYFTGLQVTMSPLINGSYAKYTGQRYRIEQTGDNKAKREDQIYIDSAPDRNIKGALLKRGSNLLIFTGTVSFGTSGQFEMTGDHRNSFINYVGEVIVIAGSTSNDQEAVITSINYSIIGNVTTVFTNGTTVTELSVAITVSAATYVLAQLFYASQVLPDGPFEDAQSKQYGENIAFNIWNQYNRVMRKFEGTVDGMETGDVSDNQPPHFIHKYTLTDTDLNTGTRIFMVMHFTQDLHLVQWGCLLFEVHDPSEGKLYTGGSFKYLTEADR